MNLPNAGFWMGLRNLKILNLHDNPIGHLDNLTNLSSCPNILALTLYDTPLSLKKNYRCLLIHTGNRKHFSVEDFRFSIVLKTSRRQQHLVAKGARFSRYFGWRNHRRCRVWGKVRIRTQFNLANMDLCIALNLLVRLDLKRCRTASSSICAHRFPTARRRASIRSMTSSCEYCRESTAFSRTSRPSSSSSAWFAASSSAASWNSNEKSKTGELTSNRVTLIWRNLNA